MYRERERESKVAALSQRLVDGVKWRVCETLLQTYLDILGEGDDVDFDKVFHLWFPDDNINHYELRDGNPPADQDRPNESPWWKFW